MNALFTVFELFGDRLIFWLPLYYELKVSRRRVSPASEFSGVCTPLFVLALLLCPPPPPRLKICFVIWLTLPRFHGATILYNSFVRQVRSRLVHSAPLASAPRPHNTPLPSCHFSQYLEHYEPAIDAHIEDARRQMQTQASNLAGRSAGALQAFAFLGLGRLTQVLGSLAQQQQQQQLQQQQPAVVAPAHVVRQANHEDPSKTQ